MLVPHMGQDTSRCCTSHTLGPSLRFSFGGNACSLLPLAPECLWGRPPSLKRGHGNEHAQEACCSSRANQFQNRVPLVLVCSSCGRGKRTRVPVDTACGPGNGRLLHSPRTKLLAMGTSANPVWYGRRQVTAHVQFLENTEQRFLVEKHINKAVLMKPVVFVGCR